MQCCGWKRSENDALAESSTGKVYCGTCWQKWIESKQQIKLPHPGATTLQSTVLASEKKVGYDGIDKQSSYVDYEESLGELEGVQFCGSLYLVSRSKGLVFDSTRSEDGRLLCVGETKPGKHERDDLRLYNVDSVSAAPRFPFEASPEDHCETPFDAYEDIAPYLAFLAKCLQKDDSELKIWDPYFCNGAVKRKFQKLGFESVHNECEDFYRILKDKKQPIHDCIVTNPPYSTEPTDHVHRLVKILCKQRKPWFVVQPNYVYTKPFWEQYTSTTLVGPRPFFLTPSSPRKYKYKTPTGLRDVSSNQHLKTSPFVSMWFCWLGPKYTEKFYQWIVTRAPHRPLPLTLACTEYFLPDAFKDSNDKTRRKPRKNKKRQRKPDFSSRVNRDQEVSSKNAHKKRREL